MISNAKNAMVTADKFEEEAHDWSLRTIGKIYTAYEKVLAEQHGLDFDDLLLKLALCLRDDAELRQRLERRFTHVLIDEYQDTNTAQYEIARLLTLERRNLCATGDPDQSIYGWRGADIRNILHFEKDFPDAAVVRLEQNYRSTKRILAAASAVIEHNVSRKEKTLWTENEEGERVRVVTCEDAEEEADYIAKELQARRDRGERLADAAVFYRINAMTRAVEEALIRAGVAYQVARGTEFYNRKEIKDVLAYVRVLINPNDEVSLTRVINTPTRGIGKTTIERLAARARATGKPLLDIVRDPANVPKLGKAALGRLANFSQTLESMNELTDQRPRYALEQILLRSGLQATLNALAEHDPEPAQNVSELLNATATFEAAEPEGTLRDWLEQTALLSDVDAVDEQQDCVTLMTLHAAKGLEFPFVYMIGLEDTMLPFVRGGDDECDEEEERRLCFVGMTRCKRELTLLHARYRMMRGVSERKVRSSFLDELPHDDIQWLELDDGKPNRGRRSASRAGLPGDIEEWSVGTLVRHPEYDLGKIQWTRVNGAQVFLNVYFQCGLEKTFDLRYADLTRVDFDEIGDAF